MKIWVWFIPLVLTFNCAFKSAVYGWRKVLVKKFEHCDPNINYDATFNITIKTADDKQYIDGMVTLKEPLDNTILANVSVEMFTGKSFVYLFSIIERKACDALNKYMGEFLYDLERHAQLIPAMCPIPKGTHRVHNVLLDFKKFTTVENFPFGNLRFKYVAQYRNKNIFFCLVVEVENRMQ